MIKDISFEEAKQISKIDRKNLSKFEVEPEEKYKTGHPRHLSPKNCYMKAWQYVIDKGLEDKEVAKTIRLIHGLYRPFSLDNHCGHAWVELPGDIVFDGVLQRFYLKDAYYKYYEIIKLNEYTVDEACQVGHEFGGTYGPWV